MNKIKIILYIIGLFCYFLKIELLFLSKIVIKMDYFTILPCELLQTIGLYLDMSDLKNYIIKYPEIDTNYFWDKYVEMKTSFSDVSKNIKQFDKCDYYDGLIKKLNNNRFKLFKLLKYGRCSYPANKLQNKTLFGDSYENFIKMSKQCHQMNGRGPLPDFSYVIDFILEGNILKMYACFGAFGNNNPKNFTTIHNGYVNAVTYNYFNEIIIEDINKFIQLASYNLIN